jgi:hypothetical protein
MIARRFPLMTQDPWRSSIASTIGINPNKSGLHEGRRSQTMSNPLDLLNRFIGAIIAYGPKNKTKKARMARKAARRKKFAAKRRESR